MWQLRFPNEYDTMSASKDIVSISCFITFLQEDCIMFIVLGGGLLIIIIAVVISVVSSVVSAVAADTDDAAD